MNLLLLEPSELDGAGHCWLDATRAAHLLRVLGVQVGQQLRAGCLDQSIGTAEVLALDAGRVQVAYTPREPTDLRRERCLLLAIPRPKVLSRCLEHAAALGYTRIVLLRTARVEKSHLLSHKLLPRDIEPHLRAGLEQGQRVVMPEVQVASRFKPFVEDELAQIVQSGQRFVGHPHAEAAIGQLTPFDSDYCLAIGPEGGFVPFEVNALLAHGFTPVRALMGPLRVESALSYLTGQLDLLQRTQTRPAKRLDGTPANGTRA